MGKASQAVGAVPSVSSNISTCQVHEQKDFPNVKALEICASCDTGMCYLCANDHADDFHTIDWGFDIFNAMEAPRDEKNELFNRGFTSVIDLKKLKCPCGNNIPGIQSAAFCAAECHDRYVQSKGKCLFIRNFVENQQTRNIQG